MPFLLCDSAAAAAGASESLRAARSFADAAANLSWPTSSSQRTQKNDASIARAVEAVASRAAGRQEEELASSSCCCSAPALSSRARACQAAESPAALDRASIAPSTTSPAVAEAEAAAFEGGRDATQVRTTPAAAETKAKPALAAAAAPSEEEEPGGTVIFLPPRKSHDASIRALSCSRELGEGEGELERSPRRACEGLVGF